jgi:hypothetical protein
LGTPKVKGETMFELFACNGCHKEFTKEDLYFCKTCGLEFCADCCAELYDEDGENVEIMCFSCMEISDEFDDEDELNL